MQHEMGWRRDDSLVLNHFLEELQVNSTLYGIDVVVFIELEYDSFHQPIVKLLKLKF